MSVYGKLEEIRAQVGNLEQKVDNLKINTSLNNLTASIGYFTTNLTASRAAITTALTATLGNFTNQLTASNFSASAGFANLSTLVATTIISKNLTAGQKALTTEGDLSLTKGAILIGNGNLNEELNIRTKYINLSDDVQIIQTEQDAEFAIRDGSGNNWINFRTSETPTYESGSLGIHYSPISSNAVTIGGNVSLKDVSSEGGGDGTLSARNLYSQGTLSVDGNTTLGDSITDKINVTGTMIFENQNTAPTVINGGLVNITGSLYFGFGSVWRKVTLT
jgi:hypothetical protein